MKKSLILALALAIGMMFMGCEQEPRIPCNELPGPLGVLDICSIISLAKEEIGPECNMAKRIGTQFECELAMDYWEGDVDIPDTIREFIKTNLCPNIAEADIGVCSELSTAGQVCAEDNDCAEDLICTDGKCQNATL